MSGLSPTAAVTILYNGWLLMQNRVTPSAFTDLMDDYDRAWPTAAEREKVFAAACHVGRQAKTQELTMRQGAALTLLWHLFRNGAYKGMHKDWHAERDLVVTFTDRDGKIKIDLWAADRTLAEIEIDKAEGRQICPVDASTYPIYRNNSTSTFNEIASWALGNVLGILVHDRVDNDFGGVILTPDEIGRFRFVDGFHSLPTPDAATHRLHAAMRTAAALKLKPDPL